MTKTNARTDAGVTTSNDEFQRPTNKKLLFTLMIAAVCWFVCLLWLDSPVSRAFADKEFLPGDIEKSIALSEFMAHGFGIAVITISIYVSVPSVRRKMPRVLACAFFAGMTACLIKCFVGRIRPVHFDSVTVVDELGQTASEIGGTWVGLIPIIRMSDQFEYAIQSFPSGHTATAFGLAFGLIWLCDGRGGWFFLSMAGAAGLQRIVSQAHWPSDVVAGFVVALLVCAILTKSQLANRIFGRFESSHGGKPEPTDLNIKRFAA